MSANEELEAKKRNTMAIAYSPGKSLLTTAFMLWMSGTTIQIFSMMTTGMALINPIKAIMSMDQIFSKFDGIDLKLAKLIYVSLQLLAVGIALYNCQRMGLLPITSADWLSFLPERDFLEMTWG
jgi:ER membrane protein complex subunit 4